MGWCLLRQPETHSSLRDKSIITISVINSLAPFYSEQMVQRLVGSNSINSLSSFFFLLPCQRKPFIKYIPIERTSTRVAGSSFRPEYSFLFISRYNSPLNFSIRSSNEVKDGAKRGSNRWKGLSASEPLCSLLIELFTVTNVVNFHSLFDFVYGCHNDRIKSVTVVYCSCLLSE